MKIEFAVAVEMYLSHLRERQLSQAHIDSVQLRLNRFAAGRERNKLDQITGDDIAGYFHTLRHEAGLADGTLAGHKSTLRAFWNWCIKQGLADDNPSAILCQKKYSYSYLPVRSRSVPRSDFMAVIAALDPFAAHRNYHPRDVRDAAMVSLVADSSARRGELWELRQRDVADALNRPKELGNGILVYHVITRGKTGTVKIRFFENTAVLLRRWLECIPPETPFVFVNVRTHQRLRKDAMWLGFKRICEFADVPVFRFHATRKRVVTDIIEASGDMKVGQLLANHRSQRTTQEYYNDIQEDRVDAAAARLVAHRNGQGRGKGRGPNDPLITDFFRKVDK